MGDMPALPLPYLRLRARGFNKRDVRFRTGWRFLGSAKPTKATLTTALTGSNNDLTYTAVWAGPNSNTVTVAYVVAGNSTPLSVVTRQQTKAITVNVATDGGGAATSTAAEVRDAVNADFRAHQYVQVANAPGNDGTGVVTALAATPLAGGA